MSDVENKIPEMSLLLSTLSSQFDNMRAQLQGVLSDIPRLRAEFAVVTKKFEDSCAEVKSAVTELNKMKVLVSSVREEFARNLTTAHQSLLKIIEIKSDAVIALISDHEETKQKMDKMSLQIQDSSLDAKNAFLKASNGDIHIQLHRKKLDNIQLMLKNQELSK